MRKWMMSGLIMMLCLLLLAGSIGLGAGSAAAAASPELVIASSATELKEGEEMRLTVRGRGLEDLFGYEVKLAYDAERLRYKAATAAWSGFSVPLNREGELTFAHTKLGNSPGVNGESDLVVLVFESIGTGEATVELVSAKLVSSASQSLVLAPAQKLALTVAESADGSEEEAEGPDTDTPVFGDLDGHWAKAGIKRAAALGIVTGYPDGTFRPDGQVTRVQFTAMLARALGLDIAAGGEADGRGEEGEQSGQGMLSGQSEQGVHGGQGGQGVHRGEQAVHEAGLAFADAGDIQAWAQPLVANAVAAGIIGGYPDGTFRPGNLITRTEMAVMVVRALQLNVDTATGTDVEARADAGAEAGADVGVEAGAGTGFVDADEIPGWAQAAVAEAVRQGLIVGKGGNRFDPLSHATRAQAVTIMLSLLDGGNSPQ